MPTSGAATTLVDRVRQTVNHADPVTSLTMRRCSVPQFARELGLTC